MFKLVYKAAWLTVTLVGCIVLAGWFFDVVFLQSIFPGLPAMVANTALGFVLAGVSLSTRQTEELTRRRLLLARACAFAVAALGALTLAEYALQIDIGIDRMLLDTNQAGDLNALPGRMSPHTASCFLLSGAALYAPDATGARGVKLAQMLASAVGLVALVALVGYIYSITFLYRITSETGMALHTALTFITLSLGILLAFPRRGPVAIFTSDGIEGVVARPLLAAAVGVPLLLGWLSVLGQRAGYYDQAFGSSILVVGSVITFSSMVWFTARLLARVDRKRKEAEAARTELLKRIVTAQEEERSRLSRELHDQMGQHLSALALGLEVHSREAGPLLASGDQLGRLVELTQHLSREVCDLAWELRPPELDHLGLRDALSSYAGQWSRRTAIPVDFVSTGDGDDGRLTPEAETALYRITQEALTNIFKHAAAGNVSLLLERSREQVLVVVEDDGRGFELEALPGETPTTRKRLGLLGMKERIELAGGTLSIESARGAGTTVVARVPVGACEERISRP